MNKTNYATISQKNFPIKDYLEYLKSRSKDKQEYERKCSKSPPQIDKTNKSEPKNETQELHQLQKRYQQLEDKYKELLEKVKVRNIEHQKMKSQIANYQKMHERDTDQIERLRCIIGLIKRKTVETQVDEVQLQFLSAVRISRNNKFDQSTQDQIKFRQSAEKFHSKEKRSPTKILKHAEPSAYEKIPAKNNLSALQISRERLLPNEPGKALYEYEKQLQESGRFGKRLSNSPYSKLRFVPAKK